MSQDNQQDHISKKVVVYQIAGMDAVRVRRDIEYRVTDAGVLTMDLYYPPASIDGARASAVVIVAGFPDAGFEAKVGCKFKEMGSTVSWGRLMAASGLVTITYTNREPATDLQALLKYIRRNAASLGIAEGRIGLWAGSGNVPLALWALMKDGGDLIKCGVLCYGYTLDLEGATCVADAARTWRFSYPIEGKTVNDLPRDVPLFIVRAGQDLFPHLNEALDGFLSKAVSSNLPVTFVNHPTAPHSFDLFDESQTTREIIKQILAFVRFHLVEKQGQPIGD
jgi:hypothetical protein